MSEKNISTKGIIKALGLVFGDIGTSPIYTVTVVFLLLEHTNDNILGVLSLIVWTLVVLVTIQFAWLAMSLSIRGEGGKIVLKEILQPLLRSKKSVGLITLLAIIGVSLLIGDGIITPAISILSAVEGSVLIPGLEGLPRTSIVLIAMLIALSLFAFQKRGTEKVAGAFGPITCYVRVVFISCIVWNSRNLRCAGSAHGAEPLLRIKISLWKRSGRVYCPRRDNTLCHRWGGIICGYGTSGWKTHKAGMGRGICCTHY